MKSWYLVILAVLVVAIGLGGFVVWKQRVPTNSTAQVQPFYPTSTPAVAASSDSTTSPSSGAQQIKLTISTPTQGASVTAGSVTVRGTTVPNAELEINDTYAHADSKGNFAVPVTLQEGDNYIAVTAVDDAGNTAEQDLTVTYQPS